MILSIYKITDLNLTKQCTICNIDKSITDFHKKKGGKYGTRSDCKDCRSSHKETSSQILKRKQKYQDNKKEILAKNKAYYNRHRQQINNWRKTYRQTSHKPKQSELNQRNKLKSNSALQQLYSQRSLQRQRTEKAFSYRREYRIKNRSRLNQHSRNYRATKNRAQGSFTEDKFRKLCDQYNNSCLKCKQSLPLTADHIVPLSKGGNNSLDNIQPLCKACNSSKGTKIIDYRNSL